MRKRTWGLMILAFFMGLATMAGDDQPHCKTGKKVEDGALTSSGIVVHGHWTISVFNPDGTKDQEIEFDNALISPGVLTTALMGDAIIGGIYMTITDHTSTSTPCSGGCTIAKAGMNIGLTPDSTNLTVTQTGSSFETVRLAGNVTMTNSAVINQVQTWVLVCSNTKTVAQCQANPDSLSALTSKTLSSAVNVSTGQIVQITVDLTFS